jgi:hypothetical protein
MPVNFPDPSNLIRLQASLDAQQERRERFAREEENRRANLGREELLSAASIVEKNPNVSLDVVRRAHTNITQAQWELFEAIAKERQKAQRETKRGEAAQGQVSAAQTPVGLMFAEMARQQQIASAPPGERIDEEIALRALTQQREQELAQATAGTSPAQLEQLATLRGQAAKEIGVSEAKQASAEALKAADPVVQERRLAANLRLKIAEGGELAPQEREFLNELNRADPMVALRQMLIGELRGSINVAPQGTPSEVKNRVRADFQTDPQVQGAKIVKPENEEEKAAAKQGFLIVVTPDGRRWIYSGKGE